MWKSFLSLLILLVLILTAGAASSQGTGAIREGNVSGTTGLGSLNPLRCDNPACYRVVSLLFPHLIGIDPQTGMFAADASDPMGLAKSWDISTDGTVYTFHLRQDRKWSDGEPVTAFDVYYSYLAMASEAIFSPYTRVLNETVGSAALVDESTISFSLKQADCSAINTLNLMVLPAHVFDPDFAAQADTWQVNPDHYSLIYQNVFETAPTVSAGIFEFESLHNEEYIRLRSLDGAQGFAYIDVPDQNSEVAQFLAGDLNIIENPPLERRADIRAARDVQVVEYPGRQWYAIALNMADPQHPNPAFDKHGNPIDQGHHPILSDVRVRRAMQMAINVDEVIEAAVLGNGTPMAANQLPTSWALNPALAPIAYNADAARQLLEDAGWKDINDDGIRECVGCLYAEQGTRLIINLSFEDGVPAVIAQVVAEQLGKVGISVQLDWSSNYPSHQSFDAYVFPMMDPYPIDPGDQHLFTQAGDILQTGYNFGSYTNPRLEELYEQARTVPDCDVTQRSTIYGEIQTILQEDQPYLWLFAVNDMIAARGGVIGFDPYPNAPFWNVQDWTVLQ